MEIKYQKHNISAYNIKQPKQFKAVEGTRCVW